MILPKVIGQKFQRLRIRIRELQFSVYTIFVKIGVTRDTFLDYLAKPVPHLHTTAENHAFLPPVVLIDEGQCVLNAMDFSTSSYQFSLQI